VYHRIARACVHSATRPILFVGDRSSVISALVTLYYALLLPSRGNRESSRMLAASLRRAIPARTFLIESRIVRSTILIRCVCPMQRRRYNFIAIISSVDPRQRYARGLVSRLPSSVNSSRDPVAFIIAPSSAPSRSQGFALITPVCRDKVFLRADRSNSAA